MAATYSMCLMSNILDDINSNCQVMYLNIKSKSFFIYTDSCNLDYTMSRGLSLTYLTYLSNTVCGIWKKPHKRTHIPQELRVKLPGSTSA